MPAAAGLDCSGWDAWGEWDSESLWHSLLPGNCWDVWDSVSSLKDFTSAFPMAVEVQQCYSGCSFADDQFLLPLDSALWYNGSEIYLTEGDS